MQEQIKQIKQMHQWVVDAEHILDGSWAETPEESGVSREINGKSRVTNKEVGIRFDRFLEELGQRLVKDEISQTECACLTEFLRVLTSLRPHLIQCYDQANFPRTNNDMEGAIRKLKTRYRRISGRKNWNTYEAKVMDVTLHFLIGGVQIQGDGNNLRDWQKKWIENDGN